MEVPFKSVFSLPKTLRVSYGCGTLLSQRANTALLQEIRWVAILLRRIRAPCPKIVVARLGLKLTGKVWGGNSGDYQMWHIMSKGEITNSLNFLVAIYRLF